MGGQPGGHVFAERLDEVERRRAELGERVPRRDASFEQGWVGGALRAKVVHFIAVFVSSL